MRRIYIYEKMKYFFGYAPRVCAAIFEIQNGSSFGLKKKEKEKEEERERERQKERKRKTEKARKKERGASMRQGVMRQEQKTHCRISDPILDERICAGYAPG